MKTHDLKVWPEYYRALISGAKKFELRKNDREFQVRDQLLLREWDPQVFKDTLQSLGAVETYETEKELETAKAL